MKINKLLTMTDKQLYKEIKNTLPVPFISKKDYIVTTQHSSPTPLICVHLDTISDTPPKMLKCSNNIITAPGSKCLGADDRAGVYIALQMLKTGTKTKFEYGFFMGEEKGAVGSGEYGMTYPGHTAYIGLDRACRNGKQNTATYGYDNIDLLKCFPYPESYGSMSDCSILSGHTDVACVNVSVGYQNEHSPKETLNLTHMLETLNVMLNVDIPEKEYPADTWCFEDTYSYSDSGKVCCDWCGSHAALYYQDDNKICADCIAYEFPYTGAAYTKPSLLYDICQKPLVSKKRKKI
jgi:hypothetical protein